MALNQKHIRLLKAFGITLPLHVLIVGGSFLAGIASIIDYSRLFGSPKTDFPVMNLMTVDFSSFAYSLTPLLISFSILFLIVWGILALPKKGQFWAGVALGTVIVAGWITVGFQARQMYMEPFSVTEAAPNP